MSDLAGTPWWKRAVFYQIYPSSFCDTNADGVGDLQGIIEKLPYIVALGVDAIWLSPFFPSPMKDFGYDVADYCGVDPLFGTLSDFDRLLELAHLSGLKVIVDQVWSHTSDQHPWFAESAARRGGFEDWYVWADAKPDGTPPNNWQASFGGPAWTWHPGRRQYYLHNFLSAQPDLNFHCPAVQDAIIDVARFWLDRGIDGFRLDVINYLAHDPELRDNPARAFAEVPAATIRFQHLIRNKSQPEALEFVTRLRALLDSYDDRFAVGEIFDDDMLGRQIEYTDGPERLHTAYSFHLLNARRATPELFAAGIEAWQDARGWPSWSLGNHDVPRFATRLAHGDAELMQLLLVVLLSMGGTPFLYQGDELGLSQASVPFEYLQDPFAIASWTEAEGDPGRDGARTPMPWQADLPNAGFSAAPTCWLPLDENHCPASVSTQERDPDSTLCAIRSFLRFRREQAALQAGQTRLVAATASILAFERRFAEQRIMCVFNFEQCADSFSLEDGLEPRLLASDGLTKLSGRLVALARYGWAFLALTPTA